MDRTNTSSTIKYLLFFLSLSLIRTKTFVSNDIFLKKNEEVGEGIVLGVYWINRTNGPNIKAVRSSIAIGIIIQ
jgi:hypothetical protein